MAELRNTDIVQADIETYRNNHSDFSFEMRVLSALRAAEYSCSHSGTYNDPVSGKPREFDIRANKNFGNFEIHLAVECKNFRKNYPIVAHAVPRHTRDCWYWVVHHRNVQSERIIAHPEGHDTETPARVGRVNTPVGIYAANSPVAKSIDQVGIAAQSGKMITGDGKVFEKTSQAINSCYDLIDSAHQNLGRESIRIILPILVVPDGCLWRINYAADGAPSGTPAEVDSISYFIDQKWELKSGRNQHFRISHMEIITFGSLITRLNQMLSDTGTTSLIFNP